MVFFRVDKKTVLVPLWPDSVRVRFGESAGGQPLRGAGPGKLQELSAGQREGQVRILHEGN